MREEEILSLIPDQGALINYSTMQEILEKYR